MAGAWRWVCVLAAISLLSGALPWAVAGHELKAVGPVVAFLVIATVLADVIAAAGLFDVVGHRIARRSHGRPLITFALVAVMASMTTAVLSLDATAVLLTPVVVALARAAALPVLPYAICVVMLANTASLLLPVSNLTNLIAVGGGLPGGVSFARAMVLPWVASVVVTALVVGCCFRAELRATGTSPGDVPSIGAREARWSALSCVVLVAFVLAGVSAWLAALLALLVAAPGVRHRSWRSLGIELPWRLALMVLALFFLAATVARHGWDSWVVHAIDDRDDGFPSLLRTAGVGALTANAVDNLPAYLGLHHAVIDPQHHRALLIGVDAGPLVTPWASVATLLWAQRCRRLGVGLDLRRQVLIGLAVAIPAVVAATALL